MVLLWQMLLDKSSTAAAMREQQGFKSQQKLQDREDNKQAKDVDLREKSSKEGGAESRSSHLLSQEARCLFIFNKDAPHHITLNAKGVVVKAPSTAPLQSTFWRSSLQQDWDGINMAQWTPSQREKLTPIIGCYVPPLENALNAGEIFGQLKARKWQKDKNCWPKLIMGFIAKMFEILKRTWYWVSKTRLPGPGKYLGPTPLLCSRRYLIKRLLAMVWSFR